MSADTTPDLPSQTVPMYEDTTTNDEPLSSVGINRLRLADGTPNYDLIDRIQLIRGHIESLPETKGTFRLSSTHLNRSIGADQTLLTLVGSWQVPDRYANEKTHTYVNPNYTHLETLADGFVQCECGTLVEESSGFARDAHADDCSPMLRANARAVFWQRRYRIIHHSSRCYKNWDYTSKRLNLRKHTLKTISNRLGINRHELLDEARVEIGALGSDLHPDYSYREIGEIFDIGRTTASRIIRNHREENDG